MNNDLAFNHDFNPMEKRKLKTKALIFIGFRHRKEGIKTAQQEGYKIILLSRKVLPEAQKLFDKTFQINLFDQEVLKKVIPEIKAHYSIKGIISNYEHYVVARSYLAERFNVSSSTVYSAACTRNKLMQRHALTFMEENIEHLPIQTKKQALNAFDRLGGDVFLKSIAGIKSRLVFHAKSKQELEHALESLKKASGELDEDLYDDYKYCDFNFEYPDPKKTFLMEKAVQGSQITVASFASNHTIWHAPSVCDVYPASHLGRKDSFLAFRILPSKFSKTIMQKAKRTTEIASKILGLRHCPIHAEMIVTKEGKIKLIEIASRMGGYRARMYETAYNLNLSETLVKSVIGKEIKTRKKAQYFVSMVEIFPKEEGALKYIENIELLDKDETVIYSDSPCQPGDPVGRAKYNHPPCLRFLIREKSYKKAYEKSLFYQKKLKVVVSWPRGKLPIGLF